MPYLPMQGICEDEFHRNEHGVQSPLYGRRYSLVLYPNKGALIAFRLKKAGCKVWHSTQTSAPQRVGQAVHSGTRCFICPMPLFLLPL